MQHKKQHFVPQCYLQAWIDPECPPKFTPYVWRHTKDGRESRKKSPENIFCETDMYTIHLGDGSRSFVLEHGLNQLETLFVEIRNKKIQKRLNLSLEERSILCAFVSATHARTKNQEKHQKESWSKPLEKMESMIEQMKTTTPEEKILMSSPVSSNKGQSFDYNDVKRLAEKPIQTMLVSMIRTMTPLLSRLDLAIFTTSDKIGFITSDDPCVWFDPQAYKRPPFYRSPALIYKTTEVTLPISPNETLCLNQHGINGYFEAPKGLIDEFNTRIRFHADEYFIVNANFKKDIWFDPGVEPEDSWKKQNKEENKNE